MKRIKGAIPALPKLSQRGDFPLDVAHLLDILASIELRRQVRLRSKRAEEITNVSR